MRVSSLVLCAVFLFSKICPGRVAREQSFRLKEIESVISQINKEEQARFSVMRDQLLDYHKNLISEIRMKKKTVSEVKSRFEQKHRRTK